MRLPVLILAICLPHACMAATMTCERFESALTKAVVAGGNKVAIPVFKGSKGDSLRTTLDGIVGITVDITCADNENLEAVDVEATIDSPDDAENLQRHIRFNAMVGAVLCSLEKAGPAACYRDAERSQVAAINQLLAAKRRGETNPFGLDATEIKDPNLYPSMKAVSGTLSFTIDFTEMKSG